MIKYVVYSNLSNRILIHKIIDNMWWNVLIRNAVEQNQNIQYDTFNKVTIISQSKTVCLERIKED